MKLGESERAARNEQEDSERKGNESAWKMGQRGFFN